MENSWSIFFCIKQRRRQPAMHIALQGNSSSERPSFTTHKACRRLLIFSTSQISSAYIDVDKQSRLHARLNGGALLLQMIGMARLRHFAGSHGLYRNSYWSAPICFCKDIYQPHDLLPQLEHVVCCSIFCRVQRLVSFVPAISL